MTNVSLTQLRVHLIIVAAAMFTCAHLVNMAVYGGLNIHWFLIISLMSLSIASSIYLGMLVGVGAVLLISEALLRANRLLSVLRETRRRMMRDSGLTSC